MCDNRSYCRDDHYRHYGHDNIDNFIYPRCGMVYVDPGQLGWKPYVTSWLQRVGGKFKPETQVGITILVLHLFLCGCFFHFFTLSCIILYFFDKEIVTTVEV